jgi:glycosyltransferase involved in cell wall biosynthesis
MKVLLITPYSPLLHHDHAANDVMRPLAEALGQAMDLHVYAPGQHNDGLPSWRINGVTYHAGAEVHRRQSDRLHIYSYAARGSWSRRSTREVLAIARAVQPDILHAEYAQAAEPLFRVRRAGLPVHTSIMLHDLPGEWADAAADSAGWLRTSLGRLERAKTNRLKQLVLTAIDALLVFSERDREKLQKASGIVAVTQIGFTPSESAWIGDAPQVAAFGGALWRLENELTAIHLAREVLPLVRAQLPQAQFRIFGSRPSQQVSLLGEEPGVTVVGEVADYDDEFRHAAVALAPAMVDAGVLMKALRAMSIGCPVVLNSISAGPIVGLENGVHALIGNGPAELADQIAAAMQDRGLAQQIGSAARELVRNQYSWDHTVQTYLRVFDQLLHG